MNINRRRVALALAAMAALPACGDGIDVAEWIEEVKLHDGTVVTVWRRARARSSGFPNAKRGGDIDFELKYEPLGVKWKSDWTRDPVSFELFDGVPHLALAIKDRESCARKAKTDYAVQFLRWNNGQWVDVPQTEFPIDQALVNMHAQYWGHSTKDDAKGLIRWGDKMLRGNKTDTIKSYYERGQRFCRDFNN
jgi:hypothetical protein